MRTSAYQFWREMDVFKEQKLANLPLVWRKAVRAKYQRLAKNSLKEANLYLISLVEPLEGAINISANDFEIQELAKKCAMDCYQSFALSSRDAVMGGFEWDAHENTLILCSTYGVEYPAAFDVAGQCMRLVDETFWLRNLRRSHAKARENAAREAGIVHKKHDLYVSDDTVLRRAEQVKRNAELLEGVKLQNERGEVITLKQAADAGMANHKNRHAELMQRINGFEALALKHNHRSTFATLTTPSRMHKMLSTGKENPKYDGTTPGEAQKYLVHVWAKARALLAKHGVKFYGLRVAEPHHDGTPHWHMILFYDGKKSTLKKLKFYITQKFIESDRAELHYDVTPRVQFKDMKNGQACGYVVKYVSKNLGGIEGEKSDEANVSSESAAVRVEAWASTWRIRQFQQIGGHSVTVWREMRRVDAAQLEGKRPLFCKLWESVQKTESKKADFALFIECMGGLETKPRESAFKVDYDVLTVAGRYGESLQFKVLGVGERFGQEVVATNRAEWVRV